MLERVDLARERGRQPDLGIERRVIGSGGRPVDRRGERPPRTPAGTWRYRALPWVPRHWIPLVPVRGADEQVHLRRARMAAGDPAEAAARVPRGEILEPDRPLHVAEEAVPSSGLRVDRRFQAARGADGRLHVWLGRRVREGVDRVAGRFTPDRLDP